MAITITQGSGIVLSSGPFNVAHAAHIESFGANAVAELHAAGVMTVWVNHSLKLVCAGDWALKPS